MKKFYALALAALTVTSAAIAGEITDVISSTTIDIPAAYEEQEVNLQSGTVYLVTLKDDGNGPQFKTGSSGIVTKSSIGTIKRVEVAWGAKSNEDIEVYGQHTPYSASNAVIGGTLLGTIEFSAGATTGIDIDGDWEYIGITTTAKKGKAAQFGSMSLVWSTPDETPDEPCDGIRLNEICGDDATAEGHEDWIELFNPTEKALDLAGVTVLKTDEDGLQEVICTIAEGTTVAPNAYYVVEKGTHFTSGISNNKPVTIALISPLDKRLDIFDKNSQFTHNGSHPAGGSYSVDPTTGTWSITEQATKEAQNVIYTDLTDCSAWYAPVTSPEQLVDGLKVILVNSENGYVMSYDWDTTKEGAVYLCAKEAVKLTDGDKISVDVRHSAVAVVQLINGGDGTWALKFGETNNYLNDSRFLACTGFKGLDFKKKDDAAKGTRASITFNPEGDAEIDYNAGGVIKFNLKTPTTSRFFNYDPTDKPEEHLAVTLYTLNSESGIQSVVDADAAPVYYNLQGIQISNPLPGEIVIVKKGSSASKVIIR